MIRFFLLTLTLLLSSGCGKSPIEIHDEAYIAFESGRTQEAIATLEKNGDRSDYVTGNLLAFLYLREQHYNNLPEGYRKSLSTLQLIKVKPVSPVIGVYLDLLRFNALSHSGDANSADEVMDKHCARTMAAPDRTLCIRNAIAHVILYLHDDPGHETRFYKELLAMSRAACIKTYGWDAIMSREEVQREEARSFAPASD